MLICYYLFSICFTKSFTLPLLILLKLLVGLSGLETVPVEVSLVAGEAFRRGGRCLKGLLVLGGLDGVGPSKFDRLLLTIVNGAISNSGSELGV